MNIATSLQEYLEASFDRGGAKSSKKFYVSDMGKCMRMRYVKRKGVASAFKPHVYWILQLGNILHDYGYKALEAKGLLLEAEDYVQNEHFIGRFDGIIKNGKKKSVFDFKSVGGWKMNKYVAGNDDETNIAQTLTYVMMLKEIRKDLNDTGIVVYLNKEPSDKAPFAFFQKEYHLTSRREDQLHEEMDKLVNYWEKDKLPPCTCPSWMKNYNSYLPFCSSSDNDVKGYLKHLEDGNQLISTNKVLTLVDGDTKKVLKKL